MIQTQPLDIQGQDLYSSYAYEYPMDSQQTILDFSKPSELDLTSEKNVESPLIQGAKKRVARNKGKTTKLKIECKNCKNSFYGFPSAKRVFCSNKCYSLFPKSEEILNKFRGRIPFNKGKTFSDETKKKMSEKGKLRVGLNNPFYGKKHSKETRKRLSQIHKGKKFSKESQIKRIKTRKITSQERGYWISPETRIKISEANKGKKRSIEQKKKFSEILKRLYKEGKIIPSFQGKYHSEETIEKIRKSHIGKYDGEKNPSWIDGRSYIPYTREFNNQFKKSIKERDNFFCQLCFIDEQDSKKIYKRKLAVHHINYNKLLTNTNNCITLCNRCNTLVNSNRDYWTNCFKNHLGIGNAT